MAGPDIPNLDWDWSPEGRRFDWINTASIIPLVSNEELDQGEAEAYAARAKALYPNVEKVYVSIINGSDVELHYAMTAYGAERLSRVRSYDGPRGNRAVLHLDDDMVITYSCPKCDEPLEELVEPHYCPQCGAQLDWIED